jgi:hypothetical protein
MSLQPEASRRAACAGPILTQEAWMLVMCGCSASRATACISTHLRGQQRL